MGGYLLYCTPLLQTYKLLSEDITNSKLFDKLPI